MRTHPLRILLVDDHPLLRAAVAETLARASVGVVTEAGNASDGLEIALATRPDVILLDIDLPKGSGLAILPQLVSRLPETRVVMLTVSTAHAHLVQAIANGASGYLTKDMSPEALVRAIQGVMAGDVAVSRTAAMTVVRGPAEPSPIRGRLAQLTARELEILLLLAEGLTDKAIGERLDVSPRTVETHVTHIMRKLRVSRRAAAVAMIGSADAGGTSE